MGLFRRATRKTGAGRNLEGWKRDEEMEEGRRQGAPHLPSSNVDTRQRLKRIGSTNLECVLQV